MLRAALNCYGVYEKPDPRVIGNDLYPVMVFARKPGTLHLQANDLDPETHTVEPISILRGPFRA